MAEYIEREALLKNKRYISLDRYEIECVVDIDKILEAPTADVAEVRHGKWIGKYNTIQYNDWICSCCGKYETETRNKDRLGNYCRWCGAKMDLGDDEV